MGHRIDYWQGPTDLITSKPDCTLLGEDRGDRFGHAVGLMQLLSNQKDELVFGVPKAVHETGDPEIDLLLYDQGIVYVIEGQSEFPEEIDLSFQSADVTLYGASSGDLFGYQITGGAVLSTTSEDLVVSAFQAERTRSLSEEGLVAIFTGEQIARSAGQWIALATPGDEYRIWGGRAGEDLAIGLATGDINGDGKHDLFIGAPDSQDRGGRSYLLYSEGIGLGGRKQRLIEDSR